TDPTAASGNTGSGEASAIGITNNSRDSTSTRSPPCGSSMRWSTLVLRVAQPVATMTRTSPTIARTPAPHACIASGLGARRRVRGLVQLEGHRHAHPARHRLAVLERRLERPLPY